MQLFNNVNVNQVLYGTEQIVSHVLVVDNTTLSLVNVNALTADEMVFHV